MPAKFSIFCLTAMLLIAETGCSNSGNPDIKVEEKPRQSIEHQALDSILNKRNLKGCLMVYDESAAIYHINVSNDCHRGTLPASTFKIPNSIIALESGAIKDTSHLFEWDGEPRQIPTWNRNMNLNQAFRASCVPCYQEVARKIGVNHMNAYLLKFNYGNMEVRDTNLDVFWLQGKSTITPYQQIEFLMNLFNDKLGIKDQTTAKMMDVMLIEKTDSIAIRGKTGWVLRDQLNIGWFVGCVTKGNHRYFFATRIEPVTSIPTDDFPALRKEVTLEMLRTLEILAE